MSIGTLLLIILVPALPGVIPLWVHGKRWEYAPSGAVGVLVVVFVMLLAGRVRTRKHNHE